MELPRVPRDDVLAEPTRARLFELLAKLRRPATSDELSKLTGRHANTVRVQLRRLADAGLVERTSVRQGRGRPRHMWVLAATQMPAGRPPEDPGHLSLWLARAFGRDSTSLDGVERTGTAIGRELAPASDERGVSAAMHEALTRMGSSRAPKRLGTTVCASRSAPARIAKRYGRTSPWSARFIAASPTGCSTDWTRARRSRPSSRATPDTAGCLIDIALPRA